jgi:DNA end-binding protein Ku
VLHRRERMCALEPRDGGMLLTTLRAHDEIRSGAGAFDRTLPKADQRMLEIAEKIIAQQSAEFDPTQFKDRYEDALRDLIKRKAKGEDVVSGPEPEREDKVVDLMEALQRSLQGGRGPSREKADRFMEAHARRKPARRKKPSRRSA